MCTVALWWDLEEGLILLSDLPVGEICTSLDISSGFLYTDQKSVWIGTCLEVECTNSVLCLDNEYVTLLRSA